VLPRDTRIADLLARLAATGLVPERKEYADRTRVEAEVPGDFPAANWPAVLNALAQADAFGSSDGTGGRRLWAVIRRTTSRRR
jgi:hypothetical protein